MALCVLHPTALGQERTRHIERIRRKERERGRLLSLSKTSLSRQTDRACLLVLLGSPVCDKQGGIIGVHCRPAESILLSLIGLPLLSRTSFLFFTRHYFVSNLPIRNFAVVGYALSFEMKLKRRRGGDISHI